MNKKTPLYITLAIALYAFVISVAFIIIDSNNDCLRYEAMYLREMNNIIINYSDSTADTGEFDEFMSSKAGKHYFELNKELNGEE